MDAGVELIVSVVELKGDYYQLGLTQSKDLMSLPIWGHMNTCTNLSKAKISIKNFSPKILLELQGLADGLEMDLDAIIKCYSGYDVVFPEMGCTALVHDGYYVRNYDFSPELYDARLVFCNPKGGYASVGFSQQVIGRLDGMNEKGLVVGLHFVNNKHKAEGFIATTIVRMLLEQCRNIAEAAELIAKIPQGYCYNYSIADSSGKSIIVEASPEQQVIKYTDSFICVNHFESEGLREKNRQEIEGSVKRKEHVHSLLAEELSPMSVYRHFNDGDSKLFFKDYQEYFGTLHTVIYLPEELSLIVGIGENSKPRMFSLKEFMEGTAILPENLKGVITSKRSG